MCIRDSVKEGRNLRRAANLPPHKKVKFFCKPKENFSIHEIEIFKILLNAESFEIDPEYEPGKGVVTVRTALADLYLPLEGLVDLNAERARLNKERDKYLAEIAKVEEKLANPAFTQKVPASVLEEHQKRLMDWQAKLAHIDTALSN